MQQDIRVLLAHTGQERQGDCRRGAVRGEADRDATRQRPSDHGHLGLGTLHLTQNHLSMPIECVPRIGRLDTLFAADQKLLTELRFQRRHLLAQGGLCDVQDVGGSGDAAGIDNSYERVEPSRVHAVQTTSSTDISNSDHPNAKRY